MSFYKVSIMHDKPAHPPHGLLFQAQISLEGLLSRRVMTDVDVHLSHIMC